MLKRDILHIIYNSYENWSKQFETACKPSCAVCCTQNVTITAIEGEEILHFIRENGREKWLAEKLRSTSHFTRPVVTTNSFARACMEDRDVDMQAVENLSPCPFLENNLCAIYPARPFGCRLFISRKTCTTKQPALMPEGYLGAVTALNQVIEHLGQKEYWGNMLDVLPALMDISANQSIAVHLDTTFCSNARLKTLTAEPLPGFLLDEQEANLISPLLSEIFTARIEDKTVEDILNGK